MNKEIKTSVLIRFLVEAEFINYSEDYEIIDEIVRKLKRHDELKEYEWLYKNYITNW